MHIADASGVPSPHPSTPCQEQVEFTAEMVADRCETTAEKQALSAECCKHFRRELCLLLPLLLPLPAGTMQRKLPKVIENLLYVFVFVVVFLLFLRVWGLPGPIWGGSEWQIAKKRPLLKKC